MPEFILDHGTAFAARTFNSLDTFTQGYVKTMFFTDCHSDNPELDGATFAELAPEALDRIRKDCDAFQIAHEATLAKIYENSTYDNADMGRNFWYSRNGHGTGFWDRDLGATGDALHDACKHQSVDLYRGDDGLLYLS
jgi:hypothetical protein